jgi:predicted ester cyclase
MKKIPLLMICALALFFPLSGIAQESSQLEKANKQLTADLKMYEATWDEIINKGKLDLIDETHFDKNITLVSSPQNIVGIADIKAYYRNFTTGFTNIKFTVVEVFGQGDQIAKHWNFKGKHSGVFFGIPATGKEVNISGVTLAKMKNGK